MKKMKFVVILPTLLFLASVSTKAQESDPAVSAGIFVPSPGTDKELDALQDKLECLSGGYALIGKGFIEIREPKWAKGVCTVKITYKKKVANKWIKTNKAAWEAYIQSIPFEVPDAPTGDVI